MRPVCLIITTKPSITTGAATSTYRAIASWSPNYSGRVCSSCDCRNRRSQLFLEDSVQGSRDVLAAVEKDHHRAKRDREKQRRKPSAPVRAEKGKRSPPKSRHRHLPQA